MSVRVGIRRFHRWVSMVFTLAVIANFVARGMGSGNPPDWVTYAPLPPLALLLLTGLYLFLQPYLRRSAARRPFNAQG
ncbi:MAG: hypothetical protein EOO27_37390 [Comamonadaceae bacterium]|nr:MAG: hypothetical protein EOO27_37390 [Comamonadaceae bacterium]